MKTLSLLKKAAITTAAAVLIGASALVSQASAIVYDGVNPGTNYPAFNVFTNTPSEGDESDFFRGKEETSTAASVNNVQSACTNGARFILRVMVHNAANESLNQNGNGPGVAHGTKVKVDLRNAEAKSQFVPNAIISANNATTVSDDMSITCANGKVVKLNYVAGTAKQFTGYTGTTAISDSVVTSGAAIGTHTPNGDVWGCFDQRVWVTLVVQVEEQQAPPSLGVCKVLDVKPEADRKVTATVSGEVNNAQIIGYKIDWGDGTSTEKQTDSHQYAKDDTPYVITAHVLVKFADGHTEWKTAKACQTQVLFKGQQPPIVTPPPTSTPPVTPKSLPNTGAGAVIATFLGVSGLSTLLYSRFARRFGL